MKTINLLILLTVAAIGTVYGQSVFDRPWSDKSTAIVIDPYENNKIDFAKMATDTRVVGILHRATIGNRQDKKYIERKANALLGNYLWGSYHLGLPGDPIKQADFYLDFVKATPGEVIALDIENLDPAKSMTLADAIRFIERIKEKTGRYPLFYCNDSVAKEVTKTYGKNSIFAKTPLWYARFKAKVTDFTTGTWTTYKLWQFSSELNCTPANESACLYRVLGTSTDMDVNIYFGTVAQLRKAWPF